MKKAAFALLIAGSLVACNSTETVADTKDSLDSVAGAKKEMIDSSADARKDKIDSTTEMAKDSLNKVDSAMKSKM